MKAKNESRMMNDESRNLLQPKASSLTPHHASVCPEPTLAPCVVCAWLYGVPDSAYRCTLCSVLNARI